MDELPPRKRQTPARDSLEILRRVEPVLVRVVDDVESLRRGAEALTANFSGVGLDRRNDLPDNLLALARGLDDLAGTRDAVRLLLEQVRAGQDGLSGLTRRQDAGQAELLAGVESLREALSGHGADSSRGHEALIAHIQQLQQVHRDMAEDRRLFLEGQQKIGGLVAHLDDRLNRQARDLRSIRREMRFMPVLLSLAAIMFAIAGAIVVVLRVRLS
ncbi:MAG: hypothetical protein WCF85_11745 [Rhodospirillaceae bacterium]